jgi:hypothetical protein
LARAGAKRYWQFSALNIAQATLKKIAAMSTTIEVAMAMIPNVMYAANPAA